MLCATESIYLGLRICCVFITKTIHLIDYQKYNSIKWQHYKKIILLKSVLKGGAKKQTKPIPHNIKSNKDDKRITNSLLKQNSVGA